MNPAREVTGLKTHISSRPAHSTFEKKAMTRESRNDEALDILEVHTEAKANQPRQDHPKVCHLRQ